MCPSSLVWKEFAEDVADILIYCGRKAFRATQRAIIVAKSDVPDVRIDWNGGALVQAEERDTVCYLPTHTRQLQELLLHL